MNTPRLQINLLLQAGRLLLEYNESTRAVHDTLTATAKNLTDEPCHVAISYSNLAVSLGTESVALHTVSHLGSNTAGQARVHEILDELCRGQMDVLAARACLEKVSADTPRHSRWLAALLLGAAAASLAGLLGADWGAAAVASLASALGLVVRQELGRRHASVLVLPFSAALLGAVLGGLAIRWGWTQTPELVLVVPALMVVPGPHLINALLDLIDNCLPMSLARFGLATGILLASAIGIVLGVELTLPNVVPANQPAGPGGLNLFSDMILAGIATCGFAVFYNTDWRHLWMAAVGGMTGHGLRFLALQAGCALEAATFLGGLTVGIISALIVRSNKMPVAAIAFAGAVTMIPGLSLYRTLAGALWLARLPHAADSSAVVQTFANAFQASLVVGALTLGLISGARAVQALFGQQNAQIPAPPHEHREHILAVKSR
jgi:uncharacterized membrane protein YjjP (DUF1212 family)